MRTTTLRTLAATAAASLLVSGLTATSASASTTIDLNPSHVGSMLSGHGGTCPMIDGFDAWHFVAPGTSTFESLDVTFEDAAVAALVIQDFAKHAYVYTRHGLNPTLASGTAVIDGDGSQFVLSHTCTGIDGDGVDTSTATQVSSSSITLGSSITDTATVTSATSPVTFADAVGAVSFTYCYSAVDYPTSCEEGTAIGSGPVALTNGDSAYDGVATATSVSFAPDAAGYYLLHAVYAGDGTFNESVDNGTNERVLVTSDAGPVGTTTTTQATPTTSVIGTVVTDTATVTADSGSVSPTGDVVFSYCYNATTQPTSCSAGTVLDTVSLTPGSAGVSTASYSWTPANAGYYLMHAAYAGDSDFSASADDGTNEAFTVTSGEFVLRYGDIPRMIDTGVTSRSCPGTSLGGRSIGRVLAAGVNVPVKRTWYPRRGVFTPAHSAKIAGVSTRHQPLSATEGTTVIGWHVRWNRGCPGALNGLMSKSVGYQFTTRDANGDSTTWQIDERHLVAKGDYTRDWFTLNGPRQLVLVTCAGFSKGQYRKNYVIVAHPVVG